MTLIDFFFHHLTSDHLLCEPLVVLVLVPQLCLIWLEYSLSNHLSLSQLTVIWYLLLSWLSLLLEVDLKNLDYIIVGIEIIFLVLYLI